MAIFQPFLLPLKSQCGKQCEIRVVGKAEQGNDSLVGASHPLSMQLRWA